MREGPRSNRASFYGPVAPLGARRIAVASLIAAGDTLFVETLIWAVTLLASLLLSYWFLRLVTLHPYAAALGAVTWTFSGFMMAWGTSDPVLGAAAWLPLALGGLEVARRGRPRRGIPLAGLGLALSVLAGHAQI